MDLKQIDVVQFELFQRSVDRGENVLAGKSLLVRVVTTFSSFSSEIIKALYERPSLDWVSRKTLDFACNHLLEFPGDQGVQLEKYRSVSI